MMLRGYYDIFHAGIFRHFNPGFCIEFHRVEFFCKLLVFGDRYLAAIHDPFPDPVNLLSFISSGRNRVNTPMNEHSETGLPPPFHTIIMGSILGKDELSCKKDCDDKE